MNLVMKHDRSVSICCLTHFQTHAFLSPLLCMIGSVKLRFASLLGFVDTFGLVDQYEE